MTVTQRMMDQQLMRLKATWALWIVIAAIGFNLTGHGWMIWVAHSIPECTALLVVISIAAFAIHFYPGPSWPSACLLVTGLLVGFGLACSWGLSTSLGTLMFFSALPLMAQYRASWRTMTEAR